RTAMLAATPTTGPTRRIGPGRHAAAPPPPDYYYDDYEDEPRRSTGKIVGIAAAVVLALGIIGFVAYQLFSGPPAPEQVAVPDVVGRSQQEATNAVIAANLRVAIQEVES